MSSSLPGGEGAPSGNSPVAPGFSSGQAAVHRQGLSIQVNNPLIRHGSTHVNDSLIRALFIKSYPSPGGGVLR